MVVNRYSFQKYISLYLHSYRYLYANETNVMKGGDSQVLSIASQFANHDNMQQGDVMAGEPIGIGEFEIKKVL